MGLSQKDAKILWDWKGDYELAQFKQEIKDAKKKIQKLGNRLASPKGITKKQLEAINVLTGDLIVKIRYLEKIYSIKEIAEL